MRIKGFSYFVKNEAKPYNLEDSDVVIDGHNYFYNLYEQSRLPYSFGCESNRFAYFLKGRLANFKEANLKCIFVFKGGTKEIEKTFEKKKENTLNPNNTNNDFVLPMFAYDVCKQILDEMSFDYINCPLEAKDYCVTLAKKLHCPIISQDIEYVMSNISYIPHNDMVFDNQRNSFKCLKFNLDIVLQKYGLTEDMFALFLTLSDRNCFPEHHFTKFFQKIFISSNPYHRITNLLEWLATQTKIQAVSNIKKCLNHEDQRKFTSMQNKMSEYLRNKRVGLPADLLLHGDRSLIKIKDSMWFEKGVVNKFISKPYINLYYSYIYLYKRSVSSCDDKNEYLLSTDIIVYAYNLLTNYKNDTFSLNRSTGETVTFVDTTTLPVPKPVYEAVESVFENGWDAIKELGLFEQFLNGTMRGIKLKYLGELPEDAQLLMISLTYYTMKRSNETLDELYSILLSYVMLGIVFEEREDVNITKTDYKAARDATDKYFQSNETEIKRIFDCKLNYPLIEFQHCLEEMNYLNALCGFPYKPTIYSKTYNGTFVYKILYALKLKNLDRDVFFVNVLRLPATVYSYLQNLLLIHGRLTSSVEN